jgi:hypothetical protein
MLEISSWPRTNLSKVVAMRCNDYSVAGTEREMTVEKKVANAFRDLLPAELTGADMISSAGRLIFIRVVPSHTNPTVFYIRWHYAAPNCPNSIHRYLS